MAFAFARIRMSRLELRCSDDNVLSWELAERSWCRQEGLLRQKWRLDDGRCVDVRVCGLLRREYEGENGPGS